jgi:hypothetical protein
MVTEWTKGERQSGRSRLGYGGKDQVNVAGKGDYQIHFVLHSDKIIILIILAKFAKVLRGGCCRTSRTLHDVV